MIETVSIRGVYDRNSQFTWSIRQKQLVYVEYMIETVSLRGV